MNDAHHAATKPASAKSCTCGSDAIEPEPIKPGQPGYGMHHSRLICFDCGKFNGWGRDPKVTAVVNQRATEIQRLLAHGVLTPWERQFLQTISRQRHLTDKQRAVWEKICARVAN